MRFIYLFIFFCASTIAVEAQTFNITATSANGDKAKKVGLDTVAWTPSGNAITTGQFIGTTNNQPFQISTFGVNRQYIDAAGKTVFGGSTTTDSTVKVVGSLNVSGNARIDGTAINLTALPIGTTSDNLVTENAGAIRKSNLKTEVNYATTLNIASQDSIQFNNGIGVNLFNIIRKENPTIATGTPVTGAPYVVLGNPATPRDNSALLIGRNLTGDGLFAHAVRDETVITPTTSTSSAYASFDGIATFNGGGNHHNHFRTFQSRLFYNGGTGGIIDAVNTLQSNPNITSGTVSLMHHLELVDAAGSGIVGEQIGLYIPQFSKGTSNYSIYSAGTQPSYHGGIWQTGSDIIAAGRIQASNFYNNVSFSSIVLGDNTQVQSTFSGGYNMVLIGSFAGNHLTSNATNNNTLIGSHVGFSTTTGGSNTFIGSNSGYTNTTNTNSVYLGYSAGKYTDMSNKLIIDSYDRASTYADSTTALINGTMNSNVSLQKLRFNAATVTMPYLPTGSLNDSVLVMNTGIIKKVSPKKSYINARLTTTSIPTAAATVVTFTTVKDSLGDWTTNNTFTARVSGVYQINGALGGSFTWTASGYCGVFAGGTCEAGTNNELIGGATIPVINSSNGVTVVPYSASIFMQAGETLQLKFFQSSGSTVTMGGSSYNSLTIAQY